MNEMERKLIEVVKGNLKALGVTNVMIAESLGVTKQAVGQMFTETIPLRRLNQFAEIAHCTVADLVRDSAPQEITLTISGNSYKYQLKKNN